MTTANYGQPINATLNVGMGGNPLLGLAGGIGGLAQQYGLDYANYLNINKQNYENVTQGYQTVMNNVANSLGQGGTGWGVAQGAADDINSAARNAAGGAISRSISSGTGKSTAAAALQRGVLSTQSRQLRDLGLNLADRYAGYQSQIGQNQLGFMNSVNAPPPNAAAYGMLAQQYGQTQQQAANMAMQQQALQQQQRAANQAAARGMSGTGGVSIPQMPRGGTFGSGQGGFPSGGGVNPYDFLGGNGNGRSNTGGGGGGPSIVYPGGIPNPGGGGGGFTGDEGMLGEGSDWGGGSINTGYGSQVGQYSAPAQVYNPWDPNSQLPANAPQAGGMQGGVGAATGGGGFGDMTGHFGFAGMNPWG